MPQFILEDIELEYVIEPGASWEFILPETRHDAGLVVEYSTIELGSAKLFTFLDDAQTKL